MVGGAGVANLVGADDHKGDEEMAAVRVAHASPDAPNVDVWVDGSKVLSDVPFKAISEYLMVPTGTRNVKITAAGDSSTVAFEGDLPVEAGTYTVAAIGELTSDDTEVTPWPLMDDKSVADGMAKVRLAHVSPDAPAVDVTVMDGETTLFDDVGYGEASDYLEVEPGNYTLEVRGDTDSNDGDVAATFEVSLEPGNCYTAFAAGYLTPEDEPANEPFDLVVAMDGTEQSHEKNGAGSDSPKQTGMVRVAHASPDAPNVDVWVDGTKVLSDVPFKAISEYLDVPVGKRMVRITAAGDPDTVAFEGKVSVGKNAYTVAAIGELASDDTEFTPWVLKDDAKMMEDTAQVRLAHVSPDAPAVDVTVMDGETTLFDDVGYGESSDYVSVPSGSYTLQVWCADPVATFEVDVTAGCTYTTFAAGYLTPEDEPANEPFDLVVARDETS
ncbi:DUF4397 domain-containing protein [Haladaptatus sp. W1]|uniref:DUF4397 domain-containing protein n=1 Tax=Haladaptatus sp. W1 TaxID=1897478 RepID=UPI0020C7C633|nr:DUF4397 domain-containing protein [Haladaptatus sp. W1]